MNDLTGSVNLMKKYGEELIADLIEIMKDNGSMNIWKNVSFEIVQDYSGIKLLLIAPKEIYFFSEGRKKGGWPPKGPILQWIKQRNIQFRNKKGQFIKRSSALYFIRKKIAEKGTVLPSGTAKGAPHFLNDSRLKMRNQFYKKIILEYRYSLATEIVLFLKKNLKQGSAGVHRINRGIQPLL